MNNSKFPFSYKVIWFDEFSDNPNFKYNKDCGMGIAESYADAAKQLEDYYGNDLLTIKELTLYEENSLIILDEDVIKKYADDKYNITHPCDEKGKTIIQINQKGE